MWQWYVLLTYLETGSLRIDEQINSIPSPPPLPPWNVSRDRLTIFLTGCSSTHYMYTSQIDSVRNKCLRFSFSFCFFPECVNFCRFSSARRLHILGSRELIKPSAYKMLGVFNHSQEKSCRSFSSSSDGDKDKNGKGTGNQWSCPKCGNPCTTVECMYI